MPLCVITCRFRTRLVKRYKNAKKKNNYGIEWQRRCSWKRTKQTYLVFRVSYPLPKEKKRKQCKMKTLAKTKDVSFSYMHEHWAAHTNSCTAIYLFSRFSMPQSSKSHQNFAFQNYQMPFFKGNCSPFQHVILSEIAVL